MYQLPQQNVSKMRTHLYLKNKAQINEITINLQEDKTPQMLV